MSQPTPTTSPVHATGLFLMVTIMFRILAIVIILCALVGLVVNLLLSSVDAAINQAVASSFEELDELDNR